MAKRRSCPFPDPDACPFGRAIDSLELRMREVEASLHNLELRMRGVETSLKWVKWILGSLHLPLWILLFSLLA